tara:strand:- start:32 stop:442 length:411 start_codon:yes stop_codon:yes gene_type:complete
MHYVHVLPCERRVTKNDSGVGLNPLNVVKGDLNHTPQQQMENEMIKLKKLHPKDVHKSSLRGHVHDSLQSEYGYGDYRISCYGHKEWCVFFKKERLNPVTPDGLSFKEARLWLNRYLTGGISDDDVYKRIGTNPFV